MKRETVSTRNVYRGIIHAHTSFSEDGVYDIDVLADYLKRRQLNFAMLADHAEGVTAAEFEEYKAQCRAHSSDTLLIIPGLEYTFGGLEVLLIGESAWSDAKDFAHLLANRAENKLVSILPHPMKFRSLPLDLIAHVDLIEIWNRRYDGGFFPPRRSFEIFKIVRRNNPRVHAVCGADFHTPDDPLDMITVIAAERLHADLLIKALRSGEFHTDNAGRILPANFEVGFVHQVYGQTVRLAREVLYQTTRWAVRHSRLSEVLSLKLKRRVARWLR